MTTTRHTVREVMTTAVISAYRRAAFKDIAKVMIERGITAVPVIDDGRRVVGVVSESDLLVKEEYKDVAEEGTERRWPGIRHDRPARAKADAVTAEELMTSPAITVAPDTTIAQAARLLERHHIKRLPVVDDDDQLVGIVSRRDLLRMFTRPDEEIRDEVRREVFDRLLLADPGAVSVEVSHGVVTISGMLEQKSLIPIAVRLTAATEGVVSVIDELGYLDDDTTDATRRIPRA